MRNIQPAIYLVASARNGTIDLGVTSDLLRRVHEHRTGAIAGFSDRYQCKRLVYFESHPDMLSAIAREKQLTGGSRSRKVALIEATNPTWRDLYDDLM